MPFVNDPLACYRPVQHEQRDPVSRGGMWLCLGNTGSGVLGGDTPGTRASCRQKEEGGLTVARLHVLRSQEEQFLGC